MDERNPWRRLERDPVSRRRFLEGAAATSLGAFLAACSRTVTQTIATHAARTHPAATATQPSPSAPPSPSPSEAPPGAYPKSVPHEVLLRLWRGYMADRAGELITIPHG